VKLLGQGGMGAVYAAIDTRLDRKLALKVMLPEFAANPAAKERFLREARAAARVSHDNVVIVHEADERDGVPYITMQYLQGYSLDEYLKRKGNPSIAQVLRIARETAAGLSAAHKTGLVHRDIKPANLWLEAPNGRVKVLDFGLARPVDAEVELTKSGAVVGTPAYMSPEQARGEKVDHRTDLFSLGAVLYRLCAGRLPFQGPTTMAVLMALGMEEPPPVRDLNPEVPESLASLIHQLLSKKAETRPQTADDVVKRIRSIADELVTPVAMAVPVPDEPQVVYAPMFVTAVSEANPFADIDTTEADPLVAQTVANATPEPARKKAGSKGLWLVVGSVAVLAVATAGVVSIIKNSGKPQAKDESAGVEKDIKPPVTPGKQPVPKNDPDRKAAEWVLSVGGSVRVADVPGDITVMDKLPKGRFTLASVSVNGTGVTDEGLGNLKGLNGLTTLSLQSTGVTDAGLTAFRGCEALTYLKLDGTAVTDAGLVNFKDCKSLSHLSLSQTGVTDKGLAQFKGCQGLNFLALSSTKVTDAGLAYFENCKDLTGLMLQNTAITDAGLAHFKGCAGLTMLRLEHSAMTDLGLAHFKNCLGLTEVDLSGLKITDEGLAHFKNCKTLTFLGLYLTLKQARAAVYRCGHSISA